jgi:MFS transporter, DHA1 family, tetracycline resistance protein
MHRSPLAIIFLVVFVDLLGFGIVLPLLPRYGEHFDADKPTLGMLMASFSAMQFLFAPLWGRLSDRIGRRPVLLVGLAGSTLAYFFFARVTQFGNSGPIFGQSPIFWLFVTRIGAGIAGATIPTAQAYISDVTDAKNRGKGMALIGAAFGIGFTFGPLIGAMFVPNSDSTAPSAAPGYVAAGLSALSFLAALFVLPESLKPSSATASRGWFNVSAFQHALSRPFVGLLLAAIFLTTFAFAQFESTLSLLTKELGIGERGNFFVFAYIGFVLTLAQGGLVRRLLPRVGEYRMALAGVALMTVGLACIGLATLPKDQQTAFYYLFAILPISVVGFSATTPSLQSLLSLNTHADEQGGTLGVGQSMSALARILGPVVGLSLQKFDVALPYWIGAGIMGLSLFLIATLRGAMVTNPAAANSPATVLAE